MLRVHTCTLLRRASRRIFVILLYYETSRVKPHVSSQRIAPSRRRAGGAQAPGTVVRWLARGALPRYDWSGPRPRPNHWSRSSNLLFDPFSPPTALFGYYSVLARTAAPTSKSAPCRTHAFHKCSTAPRRSRGDTRYPSFTGTTARATGTRPRSRETRFLVDATNPTNATSPADPDDTETPPPKKTGSQFGRDEGCVRGGV